MTMASFPMGSKATQEPRAKPAFSGTPSSVTFRSVRGRATL